MEYAAKRNTETKVGFFGAMLGLAVQPWETTQILLSKERPKYIITFLFFIFLVIFGPAAFVQLKYGPEAYRTERIYAFFTIFLVFLVTYTVFYGVYMFILGIEYTRPQLRAIVVYSLTPLISMFLIFYAFHYLGAKNFVFLHQVAQGEFTTPQAYAKIIPYLVMIMEFSMLIILTFSIRVLTEAGLFSAAIYSITGLIPIAGAMFATAFIAETFRHGNKDLVFYIINSLISIWGY